MVTCGRNGEKGNAVARAIHEQTGCDVRFVQADLGVAGDVSTVVAAADKAFGCVDMLVNAAGTIDRGDILSTVEALFAINSRAPFFLMQDAIRAMVRQGAPNIGSAGRYRANRSLQPVAPARAPW